MAEQTILIVGDVYVNRKDPASVFQHVREQLRGATFLFGNLESPYAESGQLWHKPAGGSWKADPKNLECVTSVGFSALSATNNHIMDYGHDALLETLARLDQAGIGHSGAGRTLDEARKPAIVEKDGCRIAFLANSSVFTPGWQATAERPGLATLKANTAYIPHARLFETPGKPSKTHTWMEPAEKTRLAEDIAAARRQADIVICSFHWGVSEGYKLLAEYQVELGRHAVDCGADVVFGHHPHVLQGIEMYKGKPIFYSMGNFSFANQNLKSGHEYENLVARCTLRDKKIVKVEYLPVRTDEALDPHILPPAQAADIVALVEERSKAFGTKFVKGADGVEVQTA